MAILVAWVAEQMYWACRWRAYRGCAHCPSSGRRGPSTCTSQVIPPPVGPPCANMISRIMTAALKVPVQRVPSPLSRPGGSGPGLIPMGDSAPAGARPWTRRGAWRRPPNLSATWSRPHSPPTAFPWARSGCTSSRGPLTCFRPIGVPAEPLALASGSLPSPNWTTQRRGGRGAGGPWREQHRFGWRRPACHGYSGPLLLELKER